jgi:hypothetical protein
MKIYIITFIFLALTNIAYAGIYDDWPDEAICTWLEQRPDHKGYLEENEKRGLNCFEREDFSPRDFVHVPLNLTMY